MPRGRVNVKLYSFFNLGSKLGCVVNSRHPDDLPQGKRAATHCAGGWASPRDGLDGCRKCEIPL